MRATRKVAGSKDVPPAVSDSLGLASVMKDAMINLILVTPFSS